MSGGVVGEVVDAARESGAPVTLTTLGSCWGRSRKGESGTFSSRPGCSVK
jgi:hypothetical protein